MRYGVLKMVEWAHRRGCSCVSTAMESSHLPTHSPALRLSEHEHMWVSPAPSLEFLSRVPTSK